MNILIKTERLNICFAKEKDIETIINFENAKENRDFVWQGSYEEHMNEIEDPSHILAVFKEKPDNRIVGYVLAKVDRKSNVFELRRIVVDEKRKAYGREAISALIEYAFNFMSINRFWLDVYPDNVIGIKLYKSLGMIHEGTLRQSYKSSRGYLDQMIFSVLKEDYFRVWRK